MKGLKYTFFVIGILWILDYDGQFIGWGAQIFIKLAIAINNENTRMWIYISMVKSMLLHKPMVCQVFALPKARI